jgi:sec-independent protein translocase protein TatA
MGDLLAPSHLLILLVILVFIFGGRKIPELARGLGEGIRSFKEGMSGNHPTTPPAQTPPADKPAEEKKQ